MRHLCNRKWIFNKGGNLFTSKLNKANIGYMKDSELEFDRNVHVI